MHSLHRARYRHKAQGQLIKGLWQEHAQQVAGDLKENVGLSGHACKYAEGPDLQRLVLLVSH